MLIKGLQKTTLIDYPGKIACTIFLFGCNFRCSFCHNPDLVINDGGKIYGESEVLEFLKNRVKYLDGVCITGGEPLVCLDVDFVRKIKDMGYKIKIDTNGSFPEKLKLLIDEGLVDYVAMDIKASREMYGVVVNSKVDLDKIEESIRIISDLENHEFRTTILPGFHDENEIKRIMEWVKGLIGDNLGRYYLQGFKNHGKFVGEGFEMERDVGEDYLDKLKGIVEGYFGDVGVRV
ncbi:anaerobic ribonucleoside-triphosphate reductase activating protein [Candidatus Pacearchaeota archaeon]|jgi:pyruvate formate lyase activating enzyme|nr:anaerobic ribonucleoside-triphosphate reductase activating protein [Candidatus Pacearchaeota archaeon]|tara:strand:+ start:882 stop:1583 length:702 start_codon:yes stop_codon:yes gene_type:complete